MHRLAYANRAALACVLLAASAHTTAQSLDEPRDCVIGPHEIVEVSSAVPGLLEEVLVERSESVRAGQLIARLESQVERASLELARAWASIDSEVRIEATAGGLDQRRHERVSQLYASNAIALEDKDRVQTEASLSALRLRQAREKRWIRGLDARKAEAALERRVVRSPIDGVVVERFRAAGEYVENRPIVRIARLDPLLVETVLPMALFGQVSVGMLGEVRTENAPDEAHRAEVTQVDRMGDAASGTFGVRLALRNPQGRIPAGMKCTLRVLAGPSPPAEAAHDVGPAPRIDAPSRVRRAASLQPVALPAAVEPEIPIPPLVPVPVAADREAPGRHRPAPADPALPVAAPACVVLGPLRDAEQARNLAEALRERDAPATARARESSESAGFIVVTAPQPDLEAARRLAASLREAGVHHLQVMYRGDYANRLSLGVYAARAPAARRNAELAGRGVVVEVLERTRKVARWWVHAGPGHPPAGGGSWLPRDLAADLRATPAACEAEPLRRANRAASTRQSS